MEQANASSMPDEADTCCSIQPPSASKGDAEATAEEAPAETAIPVNNNNVDSDIDRRQQYANAAGGFQERAARPLVRRGFAVPSTAEELHHAKSKWPEDSWQLKTLYFINSDPVQKLLICLLVLDVLILFVELAIDAWFPLCQFVIRDAISCCPADDEAHHSEGNIHRLLGGGGGDDAHHDVCMSPLVATDYTAGCDDHKYEGVHYAHKVLFWTTIVILSTFEIELILLIYLLGPARFFHHMVYVVDLFVVTCSIVLELLFRLASNEIMEVLPGILVIFRAWRFVRIGHGLVASTYEVEQHKTHLALHHIDMLEKRLRKYEDEKDIPERPEKLRRKGSNADES